MLTITVFVSPISRMLELVFILCIAFLVSSIVEMMTTVVIFIVFVIKKNVVGDFRIFDEVWKMMGLALRPENCLLLKIDSISYSTNIVNLIDSFL